MTDLVVLCNTLALVLSVSHQPLVSDPDRPPAAGDGLAIYLRAVNDGNCSEPRPAKPILDTFEVLGHQQDGVTVLHGWLPYVDSAGHPDAAEWFTWRRSDNSSAPWRRGREQGRRGGGGAARCGSRA